MQETRVHENLSVPRIVEAVIRRSEGTLSASGALVVNTKKYTGRSPLDRFFVKDERTSHTVRWGENNQSISPDVFDALWARVHDYMHERETFRLDAFIGADARYRIPVRVINEYAWHNLFMRHLLVREPQSYGAHSEEPFTLLVAPGFTCDPQRDGTRSEAVIMLDLERRAGIIAGTLYAGEQKKALFTFMNYLLPERGVLPMHCAANQGVNGDIALFFGLSGTGKTTLSTDPHRALIGDDEHGWSKEGIFNFEGGCYAKTLGLSQENEPEIWNAIRFGTILENVDVDPYTGVVDFASSRYTENTRTAYPIDHIPGAVSGGVGGHPRNIFFLTADATGVLPPIARLNSEQAMAHFLNGYTSKLGGTERGVTRPTAVFSACFGAPFLPLPAYRYASLLGAKIQEHGVNVYLVNTGWTGGPFGVGRRIDLGITRSLIKAALQRVLEEVPMRIDPFFGFAVPTSSPGVTADVLDPRQTWTDQEAYDRQAADLVELFNRDKEDSRWTPGR